MTVKQAKEEIVKILEALRADGIHVTGINISWIAEGQGDKPKLECKMKCAVSLEADL